MISRSCRFSQSKINYLGYDELREYDNKREVLISLRSSLLCLTIRQSTYLFINAKES